MENGMLPAEANDIKPSEKESYAGVIKDEICQAFETQERKQNKYPSK